MISNSPNSNPTPNNRSVCVILYDLYEARVKLSTITSGLHLLVFALERAKVKYEVVANQFDDEPDEELLSLMVSNCDDFVQLSNMVDTAEMQVIDCQNQITLLKTEYQEVAGGKTIDKKVA